MKAFLLSILLLPYPAAARPAAEYGILLLAHGGDPRWNEEVLRLRAQSDLRAPTETAFGMADPETLRAAMAKLEARGIKRVVAVPLFVNSSSEVLEQTRYVLGLRRAPSEVMRAAAERMNAALGPHAGHHGHHMFSLERAAPRLPLAMSPALDAHSLVAGVLTERAQALSREPARETVILAGHGPVDPAAEAVWRKTMETLAAEVRERGGFKSVVAATLRDDADGATRGAAVAAMRKMVSEASQGGGRAIVVPHLIARGGIEQKLVAALAGLDYAWDGRTLMPHPSIARWLAVTAAETARAPDMVRFR